MSIACVEAKRCHGDVTVIPHSPEKASADRSELVGRRRHSDRHDGPSPDQQESRGIGKRREGDDGIEVMATTRGVHGMNDTSIHEFSGHRGGKSTTNGDNEQARACPPVHDKAQGEVWGMR